MPLFPQPKASVGYAYWVCHTLGAVSPKALLMPGGVGLKEAAHKAVVQARDSLQKLDCREMADAGALNLLGLLCEHERLLGPARSAFTRFAPPPNPLTLHLLS